MLTSKNLVKFGGHVMDIVSKLLYEEGSGTCGV